MKRKIVSVLLAVLLLLPATITAAATTPVVITSDDVRGNVGDTVSVALNVVVDPPKLGQTMDSIQFVLEYDSAALEYVGIQELYQDRINILGAQYQCSVTTKTGGVAFTAAASNGSSGSGTLMHVRFRVLSAVSTMLVLKKVAYSFVNAKGTSQDRRQGGTINLGRITGQSAPTTVAPASYAPLDTMPPESPGFATDEPRFPVTETTLAPGASPSPEPVEESSDALAYIVFGLFIVVAILICVVLTLMIVRRSRNKSKLFEDDEDNFEEEDRYDRQSYEDEDEAYYRDQRYEEEEDEYQPRKKRPQEERKSPKKKRVEYEDDEDDEPPIKIVRRGK